MLVLGEPSRQDLQGIDLPEAHREARGIGRQAQDEHPGVRSQVGGDLGQGASLGDPFQNVAHAFRFAGIVRRGVEEVREQVLGGLRLTRVRRLGPEDDASVTDLQPLAVVLTGTQQVVEHRGVGKGRLG